MYSWLKCIKGDVVTQVPQTVLEEGGAWMGGGVENYDLVEFAQGNVTYKIIARGWMDLYNPNADFDSVTASREDRVEIVPGEFYDYTLYMQPNIYTVEKGHKLALVIYTYEPGRGSYNASQNYTITIDNDETFASIPVEEVPELPGNLRLSTDAHLIEKGDDFNVTPYFKNPVNSNTAVLDFTFDKEKFEYTGFNPAAGVKLVDWNETDWGVRLIVMNQGYVTSSYGDVQFSAGEDADLKKEDNEIKVSADYVIKRDDDTKVVKNEVASTIFSTYADDPDDPVTL